MAPSPWPDYQCTEPKAPDKKSNVYTAAGQLPDKCQPRASGPVDEVENQIELGQLKPRVTALDEFGLKALLDEAMTLRFSEDIEDKSVLLKGLFEEVNAKKSPRAVTAEAPKQSSSSGKPSKKNKVRKSHVVSDQNEVSNYAKHKTDSKTSSKSILGPKNVDANDNGKAIVKISNMGRLVTDTNKRGKQTVNSDERVRIDVFMKSCDMAKIVTIPGGNKTSSEGKNSKNMIRIPAVSVSEAEKRPKEHYTPNIDKICRKIDEKDIERVKALSQGVKEISIPSIQVGSNESKALPANQPAPPAGPLTTLKNQTDCQTQSSTALISPADDKKHSLITEMSISVSKTSPSDNDFTACFFRDISIRGEEQFITIKKIDENGNALCSSKIDESRKGKTRRVKVKNDKNTVMSQNIEGYRGDTDIEAVIQYIESSDDKQARKSSKQQGLSLSMPKQPRTANKIRPMRDKSSEAIRKGRRGHENNGKLKKCNSLEEVSTSRMEELTNSFSECHLDNRRSPSPHSLRQDNPKGGIVVDTVMVLPVAPVASVSVPCVKNCDWKKENKSENDSGGESEFHIVRKKQRKKKKGGGKQEEGRKCKGSGVGGRCFNEAGRRRGILNNYRYLEESTGRKPAASVPPSDKSGDSSDADSVHSLPLPVSSSKDNPIAGEACLTSYADIARSVTTPPRGGSTPTLSKALCLSSEEIPTVTCVLPTPDHRKACPSSDIDRHYPPLKKLADKRTEDLFVEFTLELPESNRGSVSVEETISIKRPPESKCISESTSFSISVEENINSNKRPPVILMNENNNRESSVVNELVFGFEVNQQLLVSAQNELTNSKLPTSEHQTETPSLPLSADAQTHSHDPHHSKSFNHCSIVQYISREWKLTLDEVKNDKSGKIVYFKP